MALKTKKRPKAKPVRLRYPFRDLATPGAKAPARGDSAKLRDCINRALALLGMGTLPTSCSDDQLVPAFDALLSVIEAGNDPGDDSDGARTTGKEGSAFSSDDSGSVPALLSNRVLNQHCRDLQNQNAQAIRDAVRRGRPLPKGQMSPAALKAGVAALQSGFHRR